MNILLFPSWYETIENPELGSFFKEQAFSLKKLGHKVNVLVVHISNWPYCNVKRWFRIKCYDDHGITVVHTTVPSFSLSKYSKLFFLLYSWQYKRLFRYYIKNINREVDIIHAHSFWPAGYAAIQIKNKYKIPVVVTEHRSIILTGELPESSWPYLKETILLSDKFLAVSHELANVIEKRLNLYGLIEVVPNMVSNLFQYSEKKATGDVLFLSVGNLVERKGFANLISAFSTVFKNEPHVKLSIIGMGEEYNYLFNLIRKQGVEDKVFLLGHKSRSEISDIMQKADVFVLTSSFETFGVVYIEALACGKPVIATANGGANDIITPDNGILIDKNDCKELEHSLFYMKEHFLEYDPQKIALNCKEKYSERTIALKLTAIYRDILKRK